MTVSEKVAYLKGLADGLGIKDSTNEGKLMLAVIDVLEAMKVDKVAVNGRSNNTQTFKQFLDLITSTGAGYEELSTGDAFSIDGVSFSVVAPDKDYAPDDLDNTFPCSRIY